MLKIKEEVIMSLKFTNELKQLIDKSLMDCRRRRRSLEEGNPHDL
jgi:hypothetical protein